jgi:hypothetical protein
MKLPIAEKLSQLSGRDRMAAIGIAMVLAVVALDRLVFGPWWRHMQHVEREISRLEGAIAAERQLLSRKDGVVSSLVAYENHLKLAGPKEDEIANLLREIESLGSESGVSLGEVKPLLTEDQGPYQVRVFEVQCEGTLSEIVRFLYLTQISESLYEIEQGAIELKEPGSIRLKGIFRLTSQAVATTGALEEG